MLKTIEVDLTARRRNNLKVLKTIDSNIIEIIQDYSHVAAYQYDEMQTKWDRLDVEGSLFVVRSSIIPLYSLIVLNKKGPIDFVLDITALKVSLQPPYLMLKCPNSETSAAIFGIWLHNEDELQAIYSLLVRISLKKERPVSISAESKADQILSLLKPIKLVKSIDEIKDQTTSNSTAISNYSSNSNISSLKLLSILKSPSTSSKVILSTSSTVQPSSPSSTITTYANVLLGINNAESESKCATYNNINTNTTTSTANSQKSQALKSLMLLGLKKETPLEISKTNAIHDEDKGITNYVNINNKVPLSSSQHKTKEELLLALVRSQPNNSDTSSSNDLLTDHDIAIKQKSKSNNNTITTDINTSERNIDSANSIINESSSNIVNMNGPENDNLEKQNLLKSILFNKITETVNESTTFPTQPKQILPFTNTTNNVNSYNMSNGNSHSTSNNYSYSTANSNNTGTTNSSSNFTSIGYLDALNTKPNSIIVTNNTVNHSSNSSPSVIQQQQTSNSISTKQIVLISPSDLKSISKAT